MVEPQATTASLKRLVPRIFSRTQPTGAVSRLIRTVRNHHPKADIAVIHRAYAVAEKAHDGQFRHSGEKYISHPVEVSQILADMGLGPRAIAAALLHDTIEDTEYTLDQLSAEFGSEVSMLVDGVTKLDKVKYGDSTQAETVRKMIVAMSQDIRVLVIKLADRLHNARTWGFVPPESAARKARETLEIYAPLAYRLGMQTVKTELEDLSFAVLQPKLFAEIDSLVVQRSPQRNELVDTVIASITEELKQAKIRGKVEGRQKEYYSIYRKMIGRGREFNEIYDLIGIRVLLSSVRDCYAILGLIHSRWTPLPGRFKDYIATPKFNLYQSLHTTVVGPDGSAVEIQIRTHDMHNRAEFGVAAHWKYKERVSGNKSVKSQENTHNSSMAWLLHISDWQAETADPSEFLDSLRFEIGARELYVFTPKGRVIALPTGATPVDFAYAVHTEIGHRTMGAKVNGRLVSLDSSLVSGDVVEVFTSKNPDSGPSYDWLSFVKSPRARNKIRQWFTKERRDESIDQGRDAIVRVMRKQNLPIQKLMVQETLSEVAAQMKYVDVSALYAAIGEGHVSTQSVIEKVIALLDTEQESDSSHDDVLFSDSRSAASRSESGILVRGAPDILVKLARCCTPVPGDTIMGFVTRASGVSVHQSTCTNVHWLQLQSEKVIEVEWAPTARSVFLVQIQIEALDRSGLLSDVTRVLSEHHVNILSASVSTTKDRLALSRFVFEMGETHHLDRVLNAVRRIDAVYDVYRVKDG